MRQGELDWFKAVASDPKTLMAALKVYEEACPSIPGAAKGQTRGKFPIAQYKDA